MVMMGMEDMRGVQVRKEGDLCWVCVMCVVIVVVSVAIWRNVWVEVKMIFML